MPYVDTTSRRLIADGTAPRTIGELNFAITRLCLKFLKPQGKETYRHYNEIIGVLECAKMEMYRRMVAPYEDGKRQENGEVYIR